MKAIILVLASFSSASMANIYVAPTDGPLTTIAGQEASTTGDRVVFFKEGHGQAIRAGDVLQCTRPNQEMASVAQLFANNPFAAIYAPTMYSLAQRGYNWLDGGCVVLPATSTSL